MKRDAEQSLRIQANDEPTAQAAFTALASPLIDEAIGRASQIGADATPEALHQLRVTLRRLRSLWWAYGPLLDAAHGGNEADMFKFLANVAGRTRNWDVLIDLLTGKHAVSNQATRDLRTARLEELASSRETLLNAHVKKLLEDARSSAAQSLNTAPERVALRKFAGQRLRTAKRSLRKRMHHAAHVRRSDYDAYHSVRKAGKKVRYLLDLFGPVVGDDPGAAKTLKKLQKRFGKLNDIVSSEALLRDNLHRLTDPDASSVALHWLERQRKRRLRAAARLLD